MFEGDAMKQDHRSKTPGIQRLFSAEDYLARLRPHLQSYGITRLADVTGLDRIGIPVVQTVRPLARSNIVNQGKGLTLAEAAVASVMEALETLAGERADTLESHNATASEIYGVSAAEALLHHIVPDAGNNWTKAKLPFLTGKDSLSDEPVAVPTALVSTDYTPASKHANSPFQRTTTGLGGGATPEEALSHGLFETLERIGTNKALHTHGFFEKTRFDPHPFFDNASRQLVQSLESAALLYAVYECPSVGGFPVIWARILDEAASVTSLPYHADGFACRETVTEAINAALLEAIQTRASVIAGGREDITWQFYPKRAEEDLLAFERNQMRSKSSRTLVPGSCVRPQTDPAKALDTEGFRTVVVPLIENPQMPLFITRVVTVGHTGKAGE